MSTIPATSNVGIISIGVTIYCLTLGFIQICIKHEAAKTIVALSTSSSFIMAIAATCIALTYYLPFLWTTDECFCHLLWSTALNGYVASVYLIKCIYVTRVHLISKDSVLGTPATKRSIIICIISLAVSSICCFSLMIILTDGTCHDDPNMYGCVATFHVINIQLAMGMLVFDTILYAGFCYKWYKIMEIFKMSDRDHKIPKKVINSFIIQFALTIIALISCFLDGVAHLLIHRNGYNYHTTMVIFLADCMIVATCNFCMISETQQLIKKFLCCCCGSASTSTSGETRKRVNTIESTRSGPGHSTAVKKDAADHSIVTERRPSCTNTKEMEGSKMSDVGSRPSITGLHSHHLGQNIPHLHAKRVTNFDINIEHQMTERMGLPNTLNMSTSVSHEKATDTKASSDGSNSSSSMDSCELSGFGLNVIIEDAENTDKEEPQQKSPEKAQEKAQDVEKPVTENVEVVENVDSPGLSVNVIDAIMGDIDEDEVEKQRRLEFAKTVSVRSGMTNFSLPEESLNAMIAEIEADHKDIEIVYDESTM